MVLVWVQLQLLVVAVNKIFQLARRAPVFVLRRSTSPSASRPHRQFKCARRRPAIVGTRLVVVGIVLVVAIVLSQCRLIRSHWQLIYAQGGSPAVIIVEAMAIAPAGAGQLPGGAVQLQLLLLSIPRPNPIRWSPISSGSNPLLANSLEREAALAAAPLAGFLPLGQLAGRGSEEVPDAGIPLSQIHFAAARLNLDRWRYEGDTWEIRGYS